jgi:hypothetical protein
VPHDVAAPPPRRYKGSLAKRRADTVRRILCDRRKRLGSIVIPPVAVPPELIAALCEAGELAKGQVDKPSVAKAVDRLFRRLARRRDFLTL